MSKVQVELVKSVITEPVREKRTVRSLGLKRMHGKVIHEVTSSLLGKLEKVKHLFKVTEV